MNTQLSKRGEMRETSRKLARPIDRTAAAAPSASGPKSVPPPHGAPPVNPIPPSPSSFLLSAVSQSPGRKCRSRLVLGGLEKEHAIITLHIVHLIQRSILS